MRILAVIESLSWVETHLVGTLTEMGHEVVCHRYGAYVGEFYGRRRQAERVEKNRALLRQAQGLKAEGLDLIFCYASDDFLTVDTARSLSQLGVPMVNYAVDTNSQWYRNIATARYFTRLLCGQRENMDNLARYGAKVLYFPFAGCAPSPDESAAEFLPAAPVTFVGTPIPYRAEILAQVERAGIPLAVYGKGWDVAGHSIDAGIGMEKVLSDAYRYGAARLRGEGVMAVGRALVERVAKLAGTRGGQVADVDISADAKRGFAPNEGLAALFRNSAINIGITRLEPGRRRSARYQVKVRDFEVPLAGGFYLVEDMPEHREFFDVGKEVVTWASAEDLIEKIRYYLAHESERLAIAAAGQRRALAEHTWARRFRILFASLGLQ